MGVSISLALLQESSLLEMLLVLQRYVKTERHAGVVLSGIQMPTLDSGFRRNDNLDDHVM